MIRAEVAHVRGSKSVSQLSFDFFVAETTRKVENNLCSSQIPTTHVTDNLQFSQEQKILAVQEFISSQSSPRSNSFDQLREATLASLDEPTPRVRARHRTLAYGVDELDLDK